MVRKKTGLSRVQALKQKGWKIRDQLGRIVKDGSYIDNPEIFKRLEVELYWTDAELKNMGVKHGAYS